MDYLFRKNSLIFLLCGTVFWCWFYYGFILNRAHVEVGLEVSRKDRLQICWAQKERAFSEDNMADIFVHPGKKHYTLLLTDLSAIEKLRIGPLKHQGEAKLLYLNIHQYGFLPIELSGHSGLEKLHPSDQDADFRLDDFGLQFRSSGDNLGFELYLHPEREASAWFYQLAKLGFLIVATWLLGICCSSLLVRHRYVLLLLAGAWTLIWVMAVTSRQNSHPDEYVHLAAANYYQQSWLPPKIEDPAIRDSYSVHGNSRLNFAEVYYLVNGKFQQLAAAFHLDGLLGMRLPNVMFFGAILLLATSLPRIRMLAVPFVVSPQVWYVFSYCNSDAFGLFVCFAVSSEVICPGSVFNRYLQTTSMARLVLSLLYLGCLAGMLLLLKKNYYSFMMFAAILVLIKHVVHGDRDGRKTRIYRLLAVVLIGLALFGARTGADYYVNGSDRAEKLAAMKEETARHRYKPSTPSDEKIFSLSLKERGVPFAAIAGNSGWYDKTFKSAFGAYGYLSVYGSATYYEIFKKVASTLLLFFLLSVIIRGGNTDRLLCLTLLLCAAVLVGGSLFHSWVVDLQPQGRYLLPLIPILALLYSYSHRLVNKTALAAGVLVLFVLSAYSFIGYGLAQIPKVIS